MRVTNLRAVFVVLGMTFSLACYVNHTDSRERRIVLRMPVSSLEEHRVSFVARSTGPHWLFLNIPLPVADDYSDSLIRDVSQRVPTKSLPREFDFAWRLSEGAIQRYSGTAADGVSGIVDSGSGGLGGHPYTARGFVFGVIKLEAGSKYTLSFEPGKAFEPLLRVSPVVQIEVQ